MLPWPDKVGLNTANLPAGRAKISARASSSWEILPCLAASPEMLEFGDGSGWVGVHLLRRGKSWNGGDKHGTRGVCGVSNSTRREALAAGGPRAKNLGKRGPRFQIPEQRESLMLVGKQVWD